MPEHFSLPSIYSNQYKKVFEEVNLSATNIVTFVFSIAKIGTFTIDAPTQSSYPKFCLFACSTTSLILQPGDFNPEILVF